MRLNLVVAMCNNRGIGTNGRLPWDIRGDMAFFKRITSDTIDKKKKNAVIMGRKTWDSIPVKFRPLRNRVNVVISRNMQLAPEGAELAESLEKAISLVSSDTYADQVENVFIIGGSSIYELALTSSYDIRIYLTSIMSDFECDTFLPEFDKNKFQLVREPSIDSSVQTDEKSGVKYKFEVYDKCRKSEMPHDPPLYIMAAMCNNRGIGKDGHLPWKPIRKDYEYYNRMTSEVTNSGMKVVRIKGRLTWEESGEAEKTAENCINIIVSSTLNDCPDHAHFIAKTLNEAIQQATSSHLSQQVEKVWIMGGQRIYEDAVLHPLVRRIYLTRIFLDEDADRFFPQFEHRFTPIKNTVDHEEHEENATRFKFEVFERKAE